MMSMRWLRVLSVLALFALVSPLAAAGSLRVGNPAIEGGNVVVPVVLETGERPNVAAMDFRFNYDPEVFRPVSVQAGSTAQAANKQVQANLASPGEYAVVIIGMNQNTVEAGDVAYITMERLNDPADGRSNVRIARTTLASPDGSEIPSQGGTGTIDLRDGEGDSDGDGDAGETGNGDAETGDGEETQQAAPGSTGADRAPLAGDRRTTQPTQRDFAQRDADDRDGGSPPVRSRARPAEEDEPREAGARQDAGDPLARAMEQADESRSEISRPRSVDGGEAGDSADGPRPQRTPMSELMDGDDAGSVEAPEWGAETGADADDRQLLARGDDAGARGRGAGETAGEGGAPGAATPAVTNVQEQGGRGLGAGPMIMFAIIVAALAGGFFVRRHLVG